MCNVCESWSDYIARVNASINIAGEFARPLLPHRCNMHTNPVSYYLNKAQHVFNVGGAPTEECMCEFRYNTGARRFWILEGVDGQHPTWSDPDDDDAGTCMYIKVDSNMIYDSIMVSFDDNDVETPFNVDTVHDGLDYVVPVFDGVGIVALHIERLMSRKTSDDACEGTVYYEILLFDANRNPVSELEMRYVGLDDLYHAI
jgi:hypothetical protein